MSYGKVGEGMQFSFFGRPTTSNVRIWNFSSLLFHHPLQRSSSPGALESFKTIKNPQPIARHPHFTTISSSRPSSSSWPPSPSLASSSLHCHHHPHRQQCRHKRHRHRHLTSPYHYIHHQHHQHITTIIFFTNFFEGVFRNGCWGTESVVAASNRIWRVVRVVMHEGGSKEVSRRGWSHRHVWWWEMTCEIYRKVWKTR